MNSDDGDRYFDWTMPRRGVCDDKTDSCGRADVMVTGNNDGDDCRLLTWFGDSEDGCLGSCN